jgi:hypothetical protein
MAQRTGAAAVAAVLLLAAWTLPFAASPLQPAMAQVEVRAGGEGACWAGCCRLRLCAASRR